MKGLKSLVLMQLKDKIDFSIVNEKKQLLRLLLLSLLKFILITAAVFVILYLCVQFIFTQDETPQVLILVLSFMLILSTISCTAQLMKNLYFADDNRVLITFPIAANKIFVSKIIVYYLYELKKSFYFLIPITLSGVILLITKGMCNWFVAIWMFIPMLFIVMLPVLIGGLLSIPAMFIYRFLKKYSIIEAILLVALLIYAVIMIVFLINLIPENIDLQNQWPIIKESIRSFLKMVEEKLFVFSHLLYSIIGTHKNLNYTFQLINFIEFGITVITDMILFILVYFLSRPFFFNMMSKNFEINKNKITARDNKKRGKYTTFIHKEFTINIRTMNISINYLIVYIIVPIMILFLNAMYKAMDTRRLGDLLIYSFNILLICLPFLASNALVATYYSREGRTGYLKKTKPIYALYPLFTKMIFNAIFSIPAILITVIVFGKSVNFTWGQIIVMNFAILLLHLGHMVYSAMLDIMNPQNEQYATTGETFDNPNENKSTIYAFVISFIYALIAYKLLSESSVSGNINDLTFGMIKLLIISFGYLNSTLMLFIKRIKAFYYEIQG